MSIVCRHIDGSPILNASIVDLRCLPLSENVGHRALVYVEEYGLSSSVVEPAQPASQRAHLDLPFAHDDVLTIAFGEHEADVKLLLVQRLGQGLDLAGADLRIGERQGYLDELGQGSPAAVGEVDLETARSPRSQEARRAFQDRS